MKLSSQQQKAVNYIGSPALVVAGAGSGKTRTLTAKIAYLINNGYDPERILAITFTNKAADEMKNRLVKLTGMPIDKFPWVRTYHSACYRILRQYCHLLGYIPPIQIYSAYHQQKIFKDIIVGKFNYEKKYVQPVMSQISNAKNYGNPDKYFETKQRIYRIPLKSVYELYEKELKEKNAVDFDNILLLTRNLIRDNKKIREKYQNLFQFILCDEYQDTNNINEEITKLLMKNGNLFAVGDDWQSVYSFRMSNVDHFLSFMKNYENAKIFRLEQNYRSANEIVQTANSLIGFNNKKIDKECFSKIKGGIIEIHKFSSDNEEAFWVAKKIQTLKNMGIGLSQMAVLYRTKFSSLAFEQIFRKFGIPYQMMGGKGFFDRREILDLNSYLAASFFKKDDTSFERIVNTPKRGIGPGTLKKINQLRNDNMSLQDAVHKALREKILSKKVYNSLTQVIQLLDDVKDMRPHLALKEIIHRVKYEEYVKSFASTSSDFISRDENIDQLIDLAATYKTIEDYLEEVTLIREDKKDEEESSGNKVILSTAHASKGLEFHVVFIVACEEGIFPHWKSDSQSGLEEERRLMYVSMTRSERYLYLTCAGSRKSQYNEPSRFLKEIAKTIS